MTRFHVWGLRGAWAACSLLLIASSSAQETSLNLVVPAGARPVLDGKISEGEWAGALAFAVVEGDTVRFRYHQRYLYVAIQSKKPFLGSICIVRSGEIAVLHSSAALGTITYKEENGNWLLKSQRPWCCRKGSPGESQERALLLNEDAWLASIMDAGNAEEMEYRIEMNGDNLRLAVTYLSGPEFEKVFWWPDNLEDDSRHLDLLRGPMPERLSFRPETWVLLRAAGQANDQE